MFMITSQRLLTLSPRYFEMLYVDCLATMMRLRRAIISAMRATLITVAARCH